MPTPLLRRLLLLLLTTTMAHPTISSGPTKQAATSILPSACAGARYPSLCVRTLSPSSPRTPTDLAVSSVSASLSSLRSALSSLRRLPGPPPGPLADCLQQLSDSADQLSRTKNELSSLRSETSRMQLDNACTWVSAALTNEDTCLDGMKGLLDGKVRCEVSGKVRDVERLTSNALYFVAHLASSRGKGKPT